MSSMAVCKVCGEETFVKGIGVCIPCFEEGWGRVPDMPIPTDEPRLQEAPSEARKPGRPRAIPDALVPKVLTLHRQGLGYRAIARELEGEDISVDWSTVRRLLKTRVASSL